MNEQAEAIADKTIEIAAETLKGDLMSCVIELAKALPKSWQELSDSDQDSWLSSVDSQIESAITQTVAIIATDGRVCVEGQLKQVVVKDETKAEIIIPRRSPHLLDLADAQGNIVRLVIANDNQFTSDEGKPEADPDQPQLDLETEEAEAGSEDLGTDADPLYGNAVAVVRGTGKASLKHLQRELQVGYNRANRLMEALESAGVVSPMDQGGRRTVISYATEETEA